MRRAISVTTSDNRDFYVYDGVGDVDRAVDAVVSTVGWHRIAEVWFFGEEGDENGRRWFGKLDTWMSVHVYRDSAIVQLDSHHVSNGTGEYVNAGQLVTRDGRIYPQDARISHDELRRMLVEFLAQPGIPEAIEWQEPSGRVATGPFSRPLP